MLDRHKNIISWQGSLYGTHRAVWIEDQVRIDQTTVEKTMGRVPFHTLLPCQEGDVVFQLYHNLIFYHHFRMDVIIKEHARVAFRCRQYQGTLHKCYLTLQHRYPIQMNNRTGNYKSCNGFHWLLLLRQKFNCSMQNASLASLVSLLLILSNLVQFSQKSDQQQLKYKRILMASTASAMKQHS